MDSLIKIKDTKVGKVTMPVVDGRDLHRVLKVGMVYKDWVSGLLVKFGYVEDVDYVVFMEPQEKGRAVRNYLLTLDTAKALARMEKRENGLLVSQFLAGYNAQAIQAPPVATAQSAGELQVVGVGIRQDAEGRFCLNDLHKAAGGESRHQPGKWLENQQTKELISELESLSLNPVIFAKQGLGTFVSKDLVYEYAMWISAAFKVKVIRAYDALVTTPLATPATMSRLQLLELAMKAEKERLQLTEKVEVLAPKAAVVDRLELADGMLNLTHAAKSLQIPPHQLTKKMHEIGWIYRMGVSGTWTAYQDKIKSGYLSHKVFRQENGDGTENVRTQVLVTPKGMTRLANILNEQRVAV